MDNKEQVNRERAKNRYYNLSDEDKKLYLENAKKNFKRWVNDNPIRYRLNLAKDRARRKGLELNINLEYLEELFEKQHGRCKYTGVELAQTENKSNSISIDRIDYTKGYIKGNVVFTSTIVNTMKNDLTENEFIRVVRLITEHYIKP